MCAHALRPIDSFENEAWRLLGIADGRLQHRQERQITLLQGLETNPPRASRIHLSAHTGGVRAGPGPDHQRPWTYGIGLTFNQFCEGALITKRPGGSAGWTEQNGHRPR